MAERRVGALLVFERLFWCIERQLGVKRALHSGLDLVAAIYHFFCPCVFRTGRRTSGTVPDMEI